MGYQAVKPLILAMLIASPASAQSCGDYAAIKGALTGRYAEQPVAVGKAPTAVFEVYASAAGTWTIVMVNPDGTACLMAAGDRWTPIIPGIDG